MNRAYNILCVIGGVFFLLSFIHWGFGICAIPFYALAIVIYIISLIVKSIKKVIKSADNIQNTPNASIALLASADIEDAEIVEESAYDIMVNNLIKELASYRNKQEDILWEKGTPIPQELLFRWETEGDVWSLITQNKRIGVSIKYTYENEPHLVEEGDEIVQCTTMYTDSPTTTYIKSPTRGICRYVGKSWYDVNACMFKIYANEGYIQEYLAEQEYKAWQEREREKSEIARKLKEKQRLKNLKREVYEELIAKGELYEETGRPPIPRDVRDIVWRRDGGKCVQCGSTQNLQFDHIIPFSRGGATSAENLQILCQKCNLAKSNKIG